MTSGLPAPVGRTGWLSQFAAVVHSVGRSVAFQFPLALRGDEQTGPLAHQIMGVDCPDRVQLSGNVRRQG